MPTQNPNDFQGNQKSTSSKKIAPGDPMWTTGDAHNQQSFGWGYDYHDPVDFLKGDKVQGGYGSGNSASNFGTVEFEDTTLNTQHGNVVDLVINRTGGTAGDIDVIIELDRDPAGTGVDLNTAILGNGRTRVVDGFDVCEVDVDIETLNLNNDDLFFDEVEQELHVKLKAGFKETRIPMVIAYRTCINSMEPARVHGTLTYRVDEYECKAMEDFGWPNMKFLTNHADCMPDGSDGVLTTKTTPHTLQYQVLSLQVPLNFTVASGPAGAPMDAYTTHLVNKFEKSPGGVDRSYTVGQTYTLESQAVIRKDPWNDPSSGVSSCAGPTNEVQQTSVYNLTGGQYVVDFPNSASFRFTQSSTFAQLTAAIAPLNEANITDLTGATPADNAPLSATPLMIEWVQSPYGGTNVADLMVDLTAGNLDGVPAGGQALQVSTIRDGDPGNLGSTVCECLTSLSAANGFIQNYGASVIVTKSGAFTDHQASTFNSTTNQVEHTYITKTQSLPVGSEPSQWKAHELQTLGDLPDLTDAVPELAPGDPTTTPPTVGASYILVNAMDNHVYGYGDSSGVYGDTIDYLFDGPGFPTGFSAPKFFSMTHDQPDDPSLDNFPNPKGRVPQWTNSKELSGAGYFWQLADKTVANTGPGLVDKWVINSNDTASSDMLYDLRQLEIDPNSYNINKERLKGYYMTCNDHQSKTLYLKIRPKDADANFSMGFATQIKIEIDKTTPYDGVKHARYDLDQTDISLVMKHLSANGSSYMDLDEVGIPTGDSLMKRLFANGSTDFPDFAPIDPTTGLATNFGPLSTNDIMFISLVEGFKANDAKSAGATNPFRSPPLFRVHEPTPVQRAITSGGLRTFSLTAGNAGDAPMMFSYENNVEDLTGPTSTVNFAYDVVKTTAARVGASNQWILQKGDVVITTYQMTPTSTGVITYTHQLQTDYIGFPPGVETEDIDFIITVN